MRQDLTDITVVMDRSGSMLSCKDDVEGGLNDFVARQRELPGECLFTLVQFNHGYEFVHRGVPIQDVGPCRLDPAGNTALLDALGRAIDEAGARLAGMPEADRPGLVVFVVITDGKENASREYTKARVKEMVAHQQGKYSWQFNFLGANIDAFTEADGLAIKTHGSLQYNQHKTRQAFHAAAGNVGRMRIMASNGSSVKNAYTDAERESVK